MVIMLVLDAILWTLVSQLVSTEWLVWRCSCSAWCSRWSRCASSDRWFSHDV
uniref:Candidate effector 15 n=1 Tax=Venturia inaequalis TaxID=5025 RepID=C0KM09_VENIN|nr:candidate effector 15 [Venturia inaequalis]